MTIKRLLAILLSIVCFVGVDAQNLLDLSTMTLESSWCMPGFQGSALTNVATWQDEQLVVTVPGNCTAQWQCQVKMQTNGLVLDSKKYYQFSCRMNTNKAVSNVTVKLFHNGEPVLSQKNNHSLVVGDNEIANPVFQGGDIATGIIVFDFGYASKGTVITVTDMELKEVEGGNTGNTGYTEEPSDEDYHLVWNADFTGSTLPSNWNIEVNGNGGGNNELQYYCEKGVSIARNPLDHKMCLVLTATKEDYKGKTCTSGRVNSLGKTYFQYGKIEARIWFPKTANGLWPAFWMMGNDFPQVGWPACGETDIIELGHSNGYKNNIQERYFNGASHWGPRSDQHYQYANSITNPYSVEDGFHIITCIWTPTKVAMYVDKDAHPEAGPYYEMGQAYSTEQTSPGYYFNKPNFIIFNLAVGGNFPGIWNINNVTALSNGPRSMYVDWVRVYQRGDEGESFYSTVASEDIETDASAIECVKESTAARKQLHNGSLYIVRGDAMYDVMGAIYK